MRRSKLVTALAIGVLGAAIGCRSAGVPPTPITETGCVTEEEGSYILTDLQPAGTTDVQPGGTISTAARPITEAYLLSGEPADLREHVGRQVRVTGEVAPGDVVHVRSLRPQVSAARPESATAETAGGGAPADADEPKVSSSYQLELQVHEMQVQAVQPTGEACHAMS